MRLILIMCLLSLTLIMAGCTTSLPLTKAVKKGDIVAVRSSIPNTLYVTDTVKALGSAIRNNRTDIADIILDSNLINYKTDKGKTVLMFAVELGDIEATKALIDHGADIEAQCEIKNQDNTTYYRGYSATNNQITTSYIGPNFYGGKKRYDGHSALSLAIKNQRLNIIRLLIENGAKVTSKEIIYQEAKIILKRNPPASVDDFQTIREEKATLVQLAEMTGDDEIINVVKHAFKP